MYDTYREKLIDMQLEKKELEKTNKYLCDRANFWEEKYEKLKKNNEEAMKLLQRYIEANDILGNSDAKVSISNILKVENESFKKIMEVLGE